MTYTIEGAYSHNGTPIEVKHYAAPNEAGMEYCAETKDGTFGSWGHSEAQALNNLIEWMSKFSEGFAPSPYGELP